jgi:predicted RNA methylase
VSARSMFTPSRASFVANLRLDQFFTPADVACRLASLIQPFTPLSVVDSNCGHGELLAACQSVSSCKTFAGMDIDNQVIRTLSSARPSWHLHGGDALTRKAWSAFEDPHFCAAVLNPPFSLKSKRTSRTEFASTELVASPALSHVLAAIEFGRPKVIAAILPESCASSELDRIARARIEQAYDVEVVERLGSKTFPGAAANAFIARMVRRGRSDLKATASGLVPGASRVEVVRGGLPVHLRVPQLHSGLPYVHSTDLRHLCKSSIGALERVRPIGRGVLSGHFVLFPRVGVPALDALEAVSLHQRVQLSDCVMGLRCRSGQHAQRVAEFLQSNYIAFCGLYRGTGARYTTVAAVENWLSATPHP